jgi:hypothetical protein
MTGLLTKEQIELLDYKDCKAAIKLLFKTHRMETSWAELTKEEWAMTDDICNTLLWLEDRVKLFEDPRVPSMDPGVAVVKPTPVKIAKSGPKRRQFQIGDKIYADVHDASKKTGIAVNTLRTYVSRKPDKYSYVD